MSGERQGVVAVIERDGRLLVIRRSAQVVAPGAFCFPGGGIEPGESEEAALVRELREELCVPVQPVRLLWRSTTPWGVRLAWWRAGLAPSAVLEPVAAEVESVHWLTPAEIRSLDGLLESNHHFFAALERGEIEW
ncbi:MAG TPA: NUDIX domain-containing protein [Pirellulales bacterium]|jgi:8-oxo-dGTP pyrophosphatase MutT (NUDIX family)|nr:NUDIX domain-containing protein [Pirellulales bacterium]